MTEVAISGKLRERIIEEARSRIATPPAEDEITTNMMAEELGCSKRQAGTILQNMVEEGRATVRNNGISGCNVYKAKD